MKNYYVDENIITRFLAKTGPFNYKKLTLLLKELNHNFDKKKIYASVALIRAILDHIPPLLGCNSFESVVSNYGWTDSHRKYMQSLLSFKDSADDALHTQITNKEDYLSVEDLPTRVKINTLLEECVTKGGNNLLPTNQLVKNKVSFQTPQIKLILNLAEEKVSWANYSVGNYRTWDCFRLVLFIDNFKSNKNDYVNVSLTAKSNDDTWIAKNFVFIEGSMESANIRENIEYKIEAGKKETIQVFISDCKYGTAEKRPMPEFNRDTLYLKAKTATDKEFSIRIKPGWIQLG